ncbi:hypothetical protein [Arthrobacter sp. M4]|uniref:hypothetical protein n=1 Tax=Arthrobacter sp. M4 TaxID=218160 RepID=UPI001CDBB375|nr:hypothetical protein [Arthrobacter sp. M4]MCA4131730.1 hypothetical protein [Arthrobacter sp. M4]
MALGWPFRRPGPAAIIAYIVCGLVALVVAWALAEMAVVHRTALFASVISLVAADTAYLALFGVSVFGALVVWILILVTHFRFRVLRERLNLPVSPARLKGAPVTTVLAMLFVATVLASTLFIDGLKWAWIAGLFLAVVLGAYFYVDKRTKGSIGRYDPWPKKSRQPTHYRAQASWLARSWRNNISFLTGVMKLILLGGSVNESSQALVNRPPSAMS